MSDLKHGVVRWDGKLNFTGESGSGFTVRMGAGEGAEGASPMELVLLAVGGCTGVDVVDILRKKRQPLTALEIRVDGQRRDEHPRIYETVTVTYIFTGVDLDPQAVQQAVQLSEEKYCSVSAMVGALGHIETRIEIRQAEAKEPL